MASMGKQTHNGGLGLLQWSRGTEPLIRGPKSKAPETESI